jgi:hypothetical protein
MDAAEDCLTSALEVVVAGLQLCATPAEIFDHLSRYFQVTADLVQVKHYRADVFLLQLADRREADRVLRAPISQALSFDWCSGDGAVKQGRCSHPSASRSSSPS